MLVSSESLCEQPGKTLNVSRSRKTKIYARRWSVMPLCRSACVRRYSHSSVWVSKKLSRFCCVCLRTTLFPSLHCLRESRCGPMPRSVSTKCEPISSQFTAFMLRWIESDREWFGVHFSVFLLRTHKHTQAIKWLHWFVSNCNVLLAFCWYDLMLPKSLCFFCCCTADMSKRKILPQCFQALNSCASSFSCYPSS